MQGDLDRAQPSSASVSPSVRRDWRFSPTMIRNSQATRPHAQLLSHHCRQGGHSLAHRWPPHPCPSWPTWGRAGPGAAPSLPTPPPGSLPEGPEGKAGPQLESGLPWLSLSCPLGLEAGKGTVPTTGARRDCRPYCLQRPTPGGQLARAHPAGNPTIHRGSQCPQRMLAGPHGPWTHKPRPRPPRPAPSTWPLSPAGRGRHSVQM